MNPSSAKTARQYLNRFALSLLFFSMVMTAGAAPPTIISFSGNNNMAVLSIKFSEPVREDTATDNFNYFSAQGAVTQVTTGDVSISNGVSLVQTVFLVFDLPLPENSLITVSVSGIVNLTGDVIAPNPTTVVCRTFKFSPGLILFESFYPIGGTAVSALTGHPDFPYRSREQRYMPSFDTRTVYPNNTHDNYGARISGFFVPQISGDYRFFLRSDDSSQLFLNPSGGDPAGAILIAEEPGCCHEFSDIASAPYSLVAGQRYFIMALYKEGAGADYCQVAAKLDSDPTSPNVLYPVSGSNLGALADPTGAILTITQQPTNQFFTPAGFANPGDPTNVTFSVRAIASRPGVTNQAIFYQWQRNSGSGFNDVPGANGQDYTLSPVVADNDTQFRVLLAIPGNSATSLAASLRTNTLYRVTLATNGSGTVAKNPDQTFYASNSTVMVTATPSPGWGFSQWLGDAGDATNPLSVTMTNNKVFLAIFFQPTLTVNVTGGGSVIKYPNLVTNAYNSTVTLTALPSAGYAFTGWSGGASGLINPLSFLMTSNRVITAHFASTIPDLIVDNTNATFTGSWTNTDGFSFGATDKFGPDFAYTTTLVSSTATATFRPYLPLTGNYDVYVWFPNIHTRRCHDAEYFVSWSSTNETVSVNQASSQSGSWQLIETARKFNQGTNGFVRLSNLSDDTDRYVVADAVRWVWSTNQVTEPYIISVTKGTINATLTWLSGSNRLYRLQYKTNLTDANWLDVSGDVTAITNAASKTDNTLGNAARRFYRVELLQ